MRNLKKVIILTVLIVFAMVSAATAKTVTLAWDANTEPDVAGYMIYYSLGNPGPPYNGVGASEGDSPVNVGLVTTATLSNLPDDVDVYVSATAYNTSGLESVNTPDVFSAAVITIPDGSNTKSVTLDWDENPEYDVIGYKVYYSVGIPGPPYNGTGAYEGDSPIDVGFNTTLTVTNLPANQTIYFTSTAYNSAGIESDYSTAVSSGPLVADLDSDGILDNLDNCPAIFNGLQIDTDQDGVGDECDNCQFDPNPQQLDGDLNGVGDICDLGSDVDSDGVSDAFDNCNNIYNPAQTDADSDGIGDACTLPPTAPTLIAPEGTVTTTTPTYTWNAVVDANSYDLWTPADKTVNYSAIAAGCGSGEPTCSVTPSTVLNNGDDVKWTVRSSNAGGISAWATVSSFYVTILPPVPTLVGPSGSITTITPTYIWNAVSGATSYDLWTPADKTVNYTAVQADCDSGEPICSVTPSTVLNNDDEVTWTVRSHNTGKMSAWATASSFNVTILPAVPTLVGSSGIITTTTPTYIWNAVSGATSYDLWTPADKTVSYSAADAGCDSGEPTCSVTPATVLNNGDTINWTVRSKNTDGLSIWATASSYTITILPEIPTLVGPSGMVATTTPAYTWNAVTGATSYDLWTPADKTVNYSAAAVGCGFGEPTCSVTPTTVLNNGDNVKWTVRSREDVGYSEWGTVMSFTVQ
jgi:hypothetical protein